MTAFAFLGVPEIAIIIVVIALLLFGGRIPALARNLGRSIVEFKSGLKSGDGDKADSDREGGDAGR